LRVIYFNNKPECFGIDVKKTEKAYGHAVFEKNNRLLLSPLNISPKNISPKNFFKLKEMFNIKKIKMFDRISGINKNIRITDHINRSGVSYLVSQTPFQNQPMFPDMSNIYLKGQKEKGHTVHTLGPKKFKKHKNTEKKYIFSEATAITSTVWHYIGFNLECFGICKPTLKTSDLL